MIQLIDYTKSYKGKKAVNNVSMTINDGEIYGFIGHNGAGKSTTIKSIVGILNFERGRILINGKNIETYPIDCKKEIGYVPETQELYETIKGIDYLNFIADAYDMDEKYRKQQIEKYANVFEIYNQLNNKISSYSHGMKQKLILISAFMHNPKVLILDEPFTGLDPKAVYNIKSIIKGFANNGTSILFSTHILEVAEKLCDRVGIIKDGELVVEGKLDEIKKDSSLEAVFMGLEENEND